MTTHSTNYTVTVWRHNDVIHVTTTDTREEAEKLADRFEAQPSTDVVITERHEVHDLTTFTRELVEERTQ